MFENIEALTSTIINEEVNGNLQVYAPLRRGRYDLHVLPRLRRQA